MGGVGRGGGGEVRSLGATNGVGESLDHCRGVWEHLKPASPEAHKDCINERDENRAKGQRGEKRDMAFNIHNQVEQHKNRHVHTQTLSVSFIWILRHENKQKNKVLKCVASFFLKILFQGIWEVVGYVGVVHWNELEEEWSSTVSFLAAHTRFWMAHWCITSGRFVLDCTRMVQMTCSISAGTDSDCIISLTCPQQWCLWGSDSNRRSTRPDRPRLLRPTGWLQEQSSSS